MEQSPDNRTDLQAARHQRLLWLVLLFALGLGVYLRLKQFSSQILLDDEWHAVIQLLKGKTPGDLFLTLGRSDYSIPLGLLYWLESRWFGLSELAMRWPMMLSGLLTLGLFTGFALRRFGVAVASIFALLLALSPMLVIYSHTARPYAMTLLFSYLALYAFHRYWSTRNAGWAAAYCVVAALCVWLHPVTGPFVVAPFLLELPRLLRSRDGKNLLRLLYLGLAAALMIAALILPPLLADAGALAVKSGLGVLSLDTIKGVWFMWLGTPALVCLLAILALAAAGFRPLLSSLPLARSALLGIVLTLLALILSQPAWVQHSLTLGRYLLPAMPLILLAAALGTVILGRWLFRRGRVPAWIYSLGLLVLLLTYLFESPLRKLGARPNSHITHIRYQFDFRDDHNRMIDYQQAIPLSPFWQSLKARDGKPLEVAVAPFWFESFNWDGARWEETSGQRIVPAYLNGFCVDKRHGEVPDNEYFRFRNAAYLAQLNDTSLSQVDWLVYTKPFTGFVNGREDQQLGLELAHCADKLKEQLGEPDFEDEFLFAYKLGVP